MKEITLTDSQWELLRTALTKVRVHSYNQWKDWSDNHRGIIIAGLEESRYVEFRKKYYEEYREISHLYHICTALAEDLGGKEK